MHDAETCRAQGAPGRSTAGQHLQDLMMGFEQEVAATAVLVLSAWQPDSGLQSMNAETWGLDAGGRTGRTCRTW
jgi:hypothetical protein